MRTIPLRLLAVACISFVAQHGATAQESPRGSMVGSMVGPIVGIDHIPLAVKSLEQAAEDYGRMGYALKPGRPHANGIRNAQVKFPDGSGIELITASAARDPLSASYVELLSQGEGPGSFSLHARDLDRLFSALTAAGFGYSRQDGVITLSDPRLSFLFFGRDNRSSTDRPEHFAHPNTAVAMTAVWVATDDIDSLSRLLTALGAVASRETVFVPERTVATVFTVENGKVVLLPQTHQLIKGRPVVGASFRVSDLDAVRRTMGAANIAPAPISNASASRQLFVPPRATHGIWLHFTEPEPQKRRAEGAKREIQAHGRGSTLFAAAAG